MSMICDNCKHPTLSVLESMDVDPDERNEDRSIQILGCAHCSFMGIGLYEESGKGVSNGNLSSHRGFYVPSDKVVRLLNLIKHRRKFDVEDFLKPGLSAAKYQSFLVQKS